jgi:hypothetical protein
VLAPVQAAQAAPLTPHSLLFWLAKATQVLPLQHPPPQLLGPQGAAQTPLWQVCDPVQAVQTAPRVPHSVLVSLPTAMQVLPLQQPVQLTGPQGPPSVWVSQVPETQESVPAQLMQAEPPRPHSPVVSLATGTQVPLSPSQHPVQLLQPASARVAQAPPTHVCVPRQRMHCPPIGPHAAGAVPG